MASELLLRPATTDDLEAIEGVRVAARAHAAGSFPQSDVDPGAGVHLWVAELDGVLVGYARFTDTWLEDLYVEPDRQRQGIGTALLQTVQAQLPQGFGLWVYEANVAARGFYLAQGLVALERTDGAADGEGAPDRRMLWPGDDVMAGLRRRIDDVDDALGDLLAQRAALTRAVQDHKRALPDGSARDPEREAEVATRVARRAPELGPDRVGRIMHVVITESIDAASASSAMGDTAP